MATLITQLNKTEIHYEEVATYILNVSFNGIVGNIQSAKIKVFMPNFIQYNIGDTVSPVKRVTEQDVTGGRLITFDFGQLMDLGIAVRLSIGAQFRVTTPIHTNFICQPELWINEALYSIAIADTLTLKVIPNFELESYRVLPDALPAAGGAVVFEVDLNNTGDKGAEISNVIISCRLPEGLTMDLDFLIKGEDVSLPPFNDPSADGIQGVITPEGFTFQLATYKGYAYQFKYRVIISDTLQVGEQINTIITWTINEESGTNAGNIITLGEKNYKATISLYGPDYTVAEEYISYEIYLLNDGNQDLTNAHMIEVLPLEVVAYEFYTGTFWIGDIKRMLGASYFVDYTTTKGVQGTLGPFNTDVNSRVDLTTVIDKDDQLENLTWTGATLLIGMGQQQPPTINGIIKSDTPLGNTLLNHVDLSWDTPSGGGHSVANQTAIVQNLCILNPKLQEISPNRPVNPGEYITYRIVIDCRRSRLINPRIAVLLPSNIQYVDVLRVVYKEYFPNPKPFPTPPPVIIENFKNTGKTLVKFTFDGIYAFECRQRSKIIAEIKTKVPIGAKGEVKLNVLLNNTLNTGVIPEGIDVYRDTLDIAQTGQSYLNYAMTDDIFNKILFLASIASDKKVKGEQDSTYLEEPQVGHTLEGGLVEYKLEITNIGNADLYTVEIVDILPHVGDKGVIMTNKPRLSQYAIYNMNAITAVIEPLQQGQKQPIIQMAYSRSYDPIRFGGSFNMIGTTNDWSSELPPVITELRSFKVSTSNTVLYPGQTLRIKLQGVVPVGVVINAIAWNSFAAKVSYRDLDGQIKYLLAVEPEKVGVQIVNPTQGTGQISGIVFDDRNENGIYQSGDKGLNDIPVILYNEQLIPIKAIFTVPDVEGNPGYYMFNNLPVGKYYVRFIIDEVVCKFSPQQLEEVGGSKPYTHTGITPEINLVIQPIYESINAGMIKRSTKERVDLALLMNASANKMLRSATYNQLLLGMKLEDVKRLIEETN